MHNVEATSEGGPGVKGTSPSIKTMTSILLCLEYRSLNATMEKNALIREQFLKSGKKGPPEFYMEFQEVYTYDCNGNVMIYNVSLFSQFILLLQK